MPTDRSPSPASGGWFSTNPDKAWVEKLFLLYSPVWMAAMGLQILVGADQRWSDGALLAFSFGVALGSVLLPLALSRRYTRTPWHKSYWFKATLYLTVFQVFGSYFGSEYFFDVLGMVYRFPTVTTTLDSTLVGSGKQAVPLIMYPWAQVYFLTYHATSNVVLRKLRGLGGGPVAFALCVAAIGYAWAFLETRAMANPLLAATFTYRKLDVMLAWGSAIYATYFVCSFPIYYFLDEDADRPWTWWQAVAGALSASMLTLFLLDLSARWVGTL